MSTFLGLQFPDLPELAYELLRQYDATCNQAVHVKGYRLNVVKYWKLNLQKTDFDELHLEAEDKQLRFDGPFVFPCFFEQSETEFNLKKFGLDKGRATCVLKPGVSVLAAHGLVTQNPDKPNFVECSLGPGDRFHIGEDFYEVVYVRGGPQYLNSYVRISYDVYANMLRDLSVDLPGNSIARLTPALSYEEGVVSTVPSIVNH